MYSKQMEYINFMLPPSLKAELSKECCKNKKNDIIIDGRTVCNICGKDKGAYLVCNTSGKITDRNHINIERVGIPINPHLPESSMGTSIGWSRKPEMARLRKQQSWNSMPSKERSNLEDYKIIADHCSQKGISLKVQDTAKTIYQVIRKQKDFKTRGHKRVGLIAACIYYACKHEKTMKDSSFIAEMMKTEKKYVSSGIRLVDSLGSGIDHPIFESVFKTSKASDYIGRYCTNLGITDQTIVILAEKMSNKIKSMNVSNMSSYTPITIAASVLYYILQSIKSPPSVDFVSDKIGISSGTILKCYKNIVEYEDRILTPILLRKLGRKKATI